MPDTDTAGHHVGSICRYIAAIMNKAKLFSKTPMEVTRAVYRYWLEQMLIKFILFEQRYTIHVTINHSIFAAAMRNQLFHTLSNFVFVNRIEC